MGLCHLIRCLHIGHAAWRQVQKEATKFHTVAQHQLSSSAPTTANAEVLTD